MATIDERLEALTHTVELIADMQLKTEKGIDQLRLITEQHGQEVRRFHRVMRAALNAYLNDDGEPGEVQ